jgi:hypothetical protein
MRGRTKLGALALAMGLAAGTALAGPAWRVDAGYQLFNLNAYGNEKSKSAGQAQGAGYRVDRKDNFDGIIVATGLDFGIAKKFTAGFDISYVFSTGADKFGYSLGSGTIDYKQELSFGMVPIMATFGFSPEVEKGFHYAARLGLGYGFGWMSGKTHYQNYTSFPFTVQDYDYSYAGGTLVADLTARAGYEWRRFRVGADLGYRYATFGAMTLTSSNNPAAKVGDNYQDSSKNAISIDLGGAHFGVDLALKF